MNTAPQIRDATVADADALCRAERDVAAHYPGLLVSLPDELVPSAFRERIVNATNGVGKYLVAEVDGQTVGHASLWPMGLRQNSHVMRLHICVRTEHWHQGYGRALLHGLVTWARANPHVSKIELLVRSTNAPAIRLYRSSGFVEEGRHRNRVRLRDGRFVDDIAMALLLREA
jgi:RimJ/RimL family protein N-acetyltransferase